MERSAGPPKDALIADGGVETTQEFYTRWAALYDAIATRTPGVGSLRETAIDRLAPERGDVVVDMGCGTGANLPYLRERVGPSGVVVGVDFTPGMVAHARRRIVAEGWSNVHVVRGDATRPPFGLAADDLAATGDDVPTAGRTRLRLAGDELPKATRRDVLTSGEADAVFASFVSGMVDDPDEVVRSWADLVGSGGRLGLLDLARTTRPAARPLNGLFAGFVFAGSPSKRHGWRLPVRTVDRRLAAAHRALRDVSNHCRTSTHVFGFARVSAGTVR